MPTDICLTFTDTCLTFKYICLTFTYICFTFTYPTDAQSSLNIEVFLKLFLGFAISIVEVVDYHSMLKQSHTCRYFHRVLQVMARDKHSGTRRLVELCDESFQLVLAAWVEEVERLVEHHELRTVEQSGYNAHFLLVASREVAYFFCPSTSPFMKCSKSLSLSSVCCLLSPDTLPMNSKYSSAVRKSIRNELSI